MQKLSLLLLPLALACGGGNHAATSPTPSAGGFTAEAMGGVQLASETPVPPATAASEGRTRSSGSAASDGDASSPSASGSSSSSSAAARAERVNARSADLFGDFVRSRAAQMNFCYEEALANNPKLAGAINVAVTIASSGEVTDVDVIKRSWSGAGTEQVEGCIRAKIRTWKFPTTKAPTATFPFTLSFTK
jgi:hypothetical protein